MRGWGLELGGWVCMHKQTGKLGATSQTFTSESHGHNIKYLHKIPHSVINNDQPSTEAKCTVRPVYAVATQIHFKILRTDQGLFHQCQWSWKTTTKGHAPLVHKSWIWLTAQILNLQKWCANKYDMSCPHHGSSKWGKGGKRWQYPILRKQIVIRKQTDWHPLRNIHPLHSNKAKQTQSILR